MQNIIASLQRQREQILRDLSEEMLSRHTSLLEIAVISLYNRLVNLEELDTDQFRSEAAVAAFGAFGRGLIGPQQPVPLLFIGSDNLRWKEEWIKEITDPLTEAGWELEVRSGTVGEIVGAGESEFRIFLELLLARYISGSRQVMDELDAELTGSIQKRRPELMERIRSEVQDRQTHAQDAGSWLEPDLVENRGGLRDIYAIRYGLRLGLDIRSFEDAIFSGYLLREEVDLLQQTEKLFARLMNALHLQSGDSTTVLGFVEQETLAEKLGFEGRAGFLPVESFMRHVHRLLHGVAATSEVFWERLQVSEREAELQELEARPLEPGMEERGGLLFINPAEYPARADTLLHVFAVMARDGLIASLSTRQWVRHHRNRFDTAAEHPEVRQELLDLIRYDQPHLPVVRRFYNYGMLRCLIPELAGVHALVQHDAFHVYPVHEHHLRALTEAKRLVDGDYAATEPELTRIAREEIGDPALLHLAAILHDVGKTAETDHALHGAEVIPTIARRLDLQAEDAELLRFLVGQHTLLMDSASLRDLADEEMIGHCARTVGSVDRLNLLLALSFTDMMATGPKAMQQWQETPVLELCEKIRHRLEKGEPGPELIQQRIERIRRLVAAEVMDIMSPEALEEHFSQSPARYLLATSPATVASHLRLEADFERSGEPLGWKVSTSEEGTTQITVVSREMPGLLARTAGVLTLHDLSIDGAEVFTKKNGVVLLIFHCHGVDADRAPDWQAVHNDIRRLLQGKLALDYRIAAHMSKKGGRESLPIRAQDSEMLVDNDSSSVYTIVEVYTPDRVGVLYTMARTLLELQIRIHVAKVSIKGDLGANVFYVRTLDGEKVTDTERIEELRNALLFYLDN